MFSTAAYYLGSEATFRHELLRREWETANSGARRRRRIRNRLRLPKQPHLPRPSIQGAAAPASCSTP